MEIPEEQEDGMVTSSESSSQSNNRLDCPTENPSTAVKEGIGKKGETPSKGAAAVTVLVADNCPVVLFGVTKLLASQLDLKVVGEAASCMDILRKIDELQPDVVLLAQGFDDASCIEVLRELRRQRPKTRIVVFNYYLGNNMLDMIKLGVEGYVGKNISKEHLCEAIRTVARGNSYVDPQVGLKLILQSKGNHITSSSGNIQLTTRESAVLDHLALGKSNKEIARELAISVSTVKHHVSAILRKFGAKNRTELIKIATHEGLVRI